MLLCLPLVNELYRLAVSTSPHRQVSASVAHWAQHRLLSTDATSMYQNLQLFIVYQFSCLHHTQYALHVHLFLIHQHGCLHMRPSGIAHVQLGDSTISRHTLNLACKTCPYQNVSIHHQHQHLPLSTPSLSTAKLFFPRRVRTTPVVIFMLLFWLSVLLLNCGNCI